MKVLKFIYDKLYTPYNTEGLNVINPIYNYPVAHSLLRHLPTLLCYITKAKYAK